MQSSIKKLRLASNMELPDYQVPRKERDLPDLVAESGDDQVAERLARLEQRLLHMQRHLSAIWQKKLESAHIQGWEQGRQDGLAEVESLVAQARQQLENTVVARQQAAEKLKAELIDLVIAICGKLLGDPQVVSAEVVEKMVTEGLLILNPPVNATIRCHPLTLPHLQKRRQQLEQVACGQVLVVGDPALQPFDIHLEAGDKVVKVDLQAELAAIAEELRDELGL